MNNDGLTLNQLAERNAALVTEVEKLRAERDRLVTENAYLLNGAARELNTSWMFHKTMLGAQAALACLSLGRGVCCSRLAGRYYRRSWGRDSR